MFTSSRVTLIEQYQYYLMKRICTELTKNNLTDAGFMMSCVFGSQLPQHLIKGDGRDATMRDDDAAKTVGFIDKFHNFFKSHLLKLKDHVHFHKCESDNGHENFVLPTKVVSCFAILRERIIRHWPLDHVPFNDEMIGGKYNPFDLCH